MTVKDFSGVCGYFFKLHITKRFSTQKNLKNALGWYHKESGMFETIDIQLSQILKWAKNEFVEDDDNCIICKIVEVINHEILHFVIDISCKEQREYDSEETIVEKLNKELARKAFDSID